MHEAWTEVDHEEPQLYSGCRLDRPHPFGRRRHGPRLARHKGACLLCRRPVMGVWRDACRFRSTRRDGSPAGQVGNGWAVDRGPCQALADPSSTLKVTPCASGSVRPKLIAVVWRRIYAFQESDPLSRPPPVSFSPPNAPPISAPDGPIFTLAMPQSEPTLERNASTSRRSLAKMEDERPCGTPFCIAIASAR